jgi:hypothetical protein
VMTKGQFYQCLRQGVLVSFHGCLRTPKKRGQDPR